MKDEGLVPRRERKTMRGPVALMICWLALALVGCSRRPRALTPLDFAFVTTNMTYQDVVKRVGQPNRGYDNATNETFIMSWEWDLASTDLSNRYFMLLKFGGSAQIGSSRVRTVELVHRPFVIDFRTNQGHDGGAKVLNSVCVGTAGAWGPQDHRPRTTARIRDEG